MLCRTAHDAPCAEEDEAMIQKKATLAAAALALTTALGCSSAPTEAAGESGSRLNAKSTALWPVSKGAATVRVCWLPALIAKDRFPFPVLGRPTAATIAERKAWVKQIAESQWNALTPVRFVGFETCAGAAAKRMVQLQPIDSTFEDTGYDPGQPHAEALGQGGRGKKVFLNLLFGDEIVYKRSVYAGTAPGTTVDAKTSNIHPWVPAACSDEVKAFTPAMVGDPALLAGFMKTFRSCLQNNVLHELGHVAGFAHEQYRSDLPLTCKNQLTAAQTDLANIDPESLGDTPLGPFEAESIMSYCRTDKRAALTAEDIAMTKVVYGGGTWGGATGGVNATGGIDGVDGADGESD
jgi:hypothetical protein